MNKSIKWFPEKQSVLFRESEWNLWLKRIKTKDKRIVFLLSVSEIIYNPKKRKFDYRKLKENPIWLSKGEILELIEILQKMTKEESNEDSNQIP